MKVVHSFTMDNELVERCDVTVHFFVDQEGNFEGFTRIYSNNPLFQIDLDHLEQFVMQGKEEWWVTN